MTREDVEDLVRAHRNIPLTLFTAGASGAVALDDGPVAIRVAGAIMFAIVILREALCQWIEHTRKDRA